MDPSKLWLFAKAACVCAAGALLACGGESSSGAKTTPGAPTLVTVAAGATASSMNVSVSTPQSNPTPNAEFLGVNLANGGAASTGDTVSRGQGTATVTMYGPGLSASMKVTITGPPDITVGALTGITATDGTPGVQFPITLTGSTALGARTVVMQDPNNDITTFTGGLEVVP